MDLHRECEEAEDDEVLQQAYEKLYKESLNMVKMNVESLNKLKLGEKENEKLKLELTEAQAFVSELNAHRVTLCEKLSLCELNAHRVTLCEKLSLREKERNDLLVSSNELKKKKNELGEELHACLESRNLFESQVAKFENDLNCVNATLRRMNRGTRALDEVLSAQKVAKDKVGLGYTGGASTPKLGGKMTPINVIGNNFIQSKANEGKTSLKKTTGANVFVMLKNKKPTPTMAKTASSDLRRYVALLTNPLDDLGISGGVDLAL
ncbi:hypothetical protein Acr_14g0004890 [Actinidia rufa]|uniref:Uncharacterized protein n=1 Tax=Actinidia rufa TaxID=165716 RepID=A0A7J0FQK0_9ERIC|nr:hypothetical protein Acr_14g0004890 [Actinidia rufa]